MPSRFTATSTPRTAAQRRWGRLIRGWLIRGWLIKGPLIKGRLILIFHAVDGERPEERSCSIRTMASAVRRSSWPIAVSACPSARSLRVNSPTRPSSVLRTSVTRVASAAARSIVASAHRSCRCGVRAGPSTRRPVVPAGRRSPRHAPTAGRPRSARRPRACSMVCFRASNSLTRRSSCAAVSTPWCSSRRTVSCACANLCSPSVSAVGQRLLDRLLLRSEVADAPFELRGRFGGLLFQPADGFSLVPASSLSVHAATAPARSSASVHRSRRCAVRGRPSSPWPVVRVDRLVSACPSPWSSAVTAPRARPGCRDTRRFDRRLLDRLPLRVEVVTRRSSGPSFRQPLFQLSDGVPGVP